MAKKAVAGKAIEGKAVAKKYKFKARLDRFHGKGGWYYLEFPYDTLKEFKKKGWIRVKGTINGVEYERSLLPRGNGMCFIVVPIKMRKEAKLELGHEADVTLEIDERPQVYNVPEELQAAFDIEPDAKVVYDRQSASIKKYICLWIDEAKREQTRADRAAEILRRLTTPGETFGGRKL